MVEYGCKYYVGDEDCQKCAKYGLIMTCAGCKEDESEVTSNEDTVREDS